MGSDLGPDGLQLVDPNSVDIGAKLHGWNTVQQSWNSMQLSTLTLDDTLSGAVQLHYKKDEGMHTTATNTGHSNSDESFHKQILASDLTMEEIAHENFSILRIREILTFVLLKQLQSI